MKKQKVKGINIPLLRKIQKQILKEPKQFDMTNWFTQTESKMRKSGDRFFTEISQHSRIPNCGTAACIAGWAVAINNRLNPDQASAWASSEHKNGLYFVGYAAELLGLDDDQGDRLFYEGNWPEEFKFEMGKAYGKASKQAKVACARIDHFIKTNGEE